MADISSPRFITIRGALPEVRESARLLSLDLLLRRLPAHGRKGTAEGRHVRKSNCPASISPDAQEGRSRGVEASECGWSSTPALRLIGYRLVLTPRGRVVFGIDPTAPDLPDRTDLQDVFVGEELARHDHGTDPPETAASSGVRRESSMSVAARSTWLPAARNRIPPRICTAVRVGTPRLTSASFCASSWRRRARWASYNVQLLDQASANAANTVATNEVSASYIVVDTGPCSMASMDIWTYRETTWSTEKLVGFSVEAVDGGIGKIDPAPRSHGRRTAEWASAGFSLLTSGNAHGQRLSKRRVFWTSPFRCQLLGVFFRVGGSPPRGMAAEPSPGSSGSPSSE